MYEQNERFGNLTRGIAVHGFCPQMPKGYSPTIDELSANLQMPVLFSKQIHSNRVLIADKPWGPSSLPEVDGIVSSLSDTAIAIWSADCVPVLMIDSFSSIIAAVHCGWRGSVNGIINNAVCEMQKLGSNPENIACLIGPCIRQDSYEVGKDVYDAATEVDSDKQKLEFFVPVSQDKFMYNIPKYIKHQLNNRGIHNIYDCGINSYTNEAYPSYRREKLNNKKLEYNTLTFIALTTSKNWKSIEQTVPQVVCSKKNTSPQSRNYAGISKKIGNIVQITGRKADGSIDLHSLSIDEAYDSLEKFIKEHSKNNKKILLVITGKGSERNTDKPTINNSMPQWLQHSNLNRYVSHFTTAAKKDGGKGAIYVFLRKNTLKMQND